MEGFKATQCFCEIKHYVGELKSFARGRLFPELL